MVKSTNTLDNGKMDFLQDIRTVYLNANTSGNHRRRPGRAAPVTNTALAWRGDAQPGRAVYRLAPVIDGYDHCSLLRRLMAIAYDCCLLFSVLFFATVLVLPIAGGEAFAAHNLFYSAFLLLITYFYFVWQWKKGRQTLGMRAWHIYLLTPGSAQPGWKNLTLRFFLAAVSLSGLGAGFLWCLFDRERLAFHDRFSGTILVVAGKTARAKPRTAAGSEQPH